MGPWSISNIVDRTNQIVSSHCQEILAGVISFPKVNDPDDYPPISNYVKNLIAPQRVIRSIARLTHRLHVPQD